MTEPYTIPNNWHWTTLAKIARWTSGGTPSRKIPEYYKGDIPWVKTGELKDTYLCNTEEKITQEAIINSSAKILPVNTIILAMYGATIGRTAILGIETATNQACACAIPSEELNYKFLFYFLRSQKDNFILKSQGGAQPNISQTIIKKFPIPLPPLDEQQRIIDKIESLFAKLDKAKVLAQNVIDSYELRRSAILHKAFTGKLTNVNINNWEDCTINDIFHLQAGKNIDKSRIHKEKNLKYCYPCFGGNGIRGFVETYNRSGEYPIIGRQGALCGNINFASGCFYATEHAVVVSYKRDVVISWALYYLKYLNLNQYATATAQPGLAVHKVLKIPIKYTPYEEQKEIVSILDSLLAKEQQTKELADHVLQKIDLMKKTILAQAFRGKF